jgi:hypothetical protein
LGEIPGHSFKFSKDHSGGEGWRGKISMTLRDSIEGVELVEVEGGDGEMRHSILLHSSRGDGMIGGIIFRREDTSTNNGDRGKLGVMGVKISKKSRCTLI